MDDLKARQQVVDKIKKSTNILITVSKDPSIDALTAALSLTLLLDKLEKHGTAVFSGSIPPAISFLKPEKTFEHTTDSLQDFIIALDKEKADHLRYKVEGDVVKIFITPYRTTITSDDLQFSQGDFNVELVIALGVDKQEHLDGALDAHGKILHDAAVVTITAGTQTSNLGSTAWHDSKASGLSEMIADLAGALKSDKDLIDQQVATAMLTGIVAQTDRFSNTLTTAKVMTVSADLMAAGADPQLIAAKLEESHDDEPSQPSSNKDSAEHVDLKEDERSKVKKDGGLQIVHGETLQEMEDRVSEKNDDPDATIKDLHTSVDAPLVDDEPSMGGTLNATSEQAAEDARHQKENDQNKTILSHTYLSDSPTQQPTMSGAAAPEETNNIVDPLSEQANPEANSAYALDPLQEAASSAEQPSEPASPEQPASGVLQDTPSPAQDAVPTPSSLGLPMPPPLPDFSSNQASAAPASTPVPPSPPERLGDILAPEQPATPATDVAPTQEVPASNPPTTPNQNDPAQFKIPGQQ